MVDEAHKVDPAPKSCPIVYVDPYFTKARKRRMDRRSVTIGKPSHGTCLASRQTVVARFQTGIQQKATGILGVHRSCRTLRAGRASASTLRRAEVLVVMLDKS